MISEHTIIYLTMWAGWATAAATIGLAIAAGFAWAHSRSSLHTMEMQIEDQKASAAAAIDAQRELSIGTRQRALLADYHVALMDMAEASDNKDADMERLIAKAATAWTSWAMEMFTIDPDFRELTGKWNYKFRFEAGLIFLRASDETNTELLGPMIRRQERDDLQTRIGSYIGKLHVWQVDPKRRTEMSEGLTVAYGDKNA